MKFAFLCASAGVLALSSCAGLSIADTARGGAQIYETYCAVCHSGGWQGAPVANDASEWTPRLAKGAEAVFRNVQAGVNGMPPMGSCTDCTDDELRAAIEEMTAR